MTNYGHIWLFEGVCDVNSRNLDPRREWWGRNRAGNVSKREASRPEPGEFCQKCAYQSRGVTKVKNLLPMLREKLFFLASHAAWESHFAVFDTLLR